MRKSPKDDAARIRELENRLAEALKREAEALDQQTATAEILRVISQSPTDLAPVAQAIAENAARLCEATYTAVFRFDGELIHWVAAKGASAAQEEALRIVWPRPATPERLVGRTILGGTTLHIEDVAADPTFTVMPAARAVLAIRTVLNVPMLRDGRPVGVIGLIRSEVKPFSAREISLVQTFADQAVIALENVRMFTELQQKNGALTRAHAQVTEALEQKTATSEVLRVISRSPTDAQPVFDAILESSVTLCGAVVGAIYRRDGDLVRLAGIHSRYPEAAEVRSAYPAPLTSTLMSCRSIHDNAVIHVADTEAPGALSPEALRLARSAGFRSVVAVPMRRERDPIGAILVGRPAVSPFPEEQIALLQTFADQAVIAIENVRLFTELQEKNRALTQAHAQMTEALERQTATSEILRVISSSPSDTQPVFDTIVRNGSRLCNGLYTLVTRFDGELLHLVAQHNAGAAADLVARAFPTRPNRSVPSARAVLERTIVHIPDWEADPDVSPDLARAAGARSFLSVPMFRDGKVIGNIAISKREAGPFTDEQVALLRTFADQAVIAIENARLFDELQARTAALTRSVGELTALGEVGRALSSTLDLETVLQTVVVRANELAGTAGCSIWEYDEARGEFRLRASDYRDEADATTLQGADRVTAIRRGIGVTTQVMERRQPVQVLDIAVGGAEEHPMRRRLIEVGHHALLGVPLLSEDDVIGVLAVTRKTPGEFEPEVVRLLSTFATHSALAIQNARLFREIEQKSHELEAASRHKSEFLANMSHELRTPLNAIIGYSEMLQEEAREQHQDAFIPDLTKINAAAKHQLSLISDILDLSKIEAGRMELDLTDFHLPTTLDNALTLVRERATRRGIQLRATMDPRLGGVRADERKIKQVVLNLLSNAIKFTPEGGQIEVAGAARDGTVEVSVRDTGVGIAPEDHGPVFEEFRQVGTADKKVEGTGLGLALCRRFVELHGGRIWVTSQVGAGSTFTFTLPVGRE